MKRFLTILMLFVMLSSFAAIFLPLGTFAAEDSLAWRRIQYSLVPTEEGIEPEKLALTSEAKIAGPANLWFDASKTQLSVNGVAVENGHELFKAGVYEITLVNVANEAQRNSYKIKIMPNINVATGQVFTEYPTIICTNAERIEHQRNLDLAEEIASGTQLRTLGKNTLIVYSRDEKQNLIKDTYVFHIKAVHSEKIYDAENGHALKVTVGTFDDLVVEATLDGDRPLNVGANIVHEVGTHTLAAKINGAEFTDLLALPDSNDLSLRIAINFGSMTQTTPFYFDFTGWEKANILLDGKPVSGEVRVDWFGGHKLEVKDANGKTVEYAFEISVNDVKKGNWTTVPFNFQNPHFYIALATALLAIAAVVIAAILFVARRRLV